MPPSAGVSLTPVVSQDDLTQRHSDLPALLGPAASYQPYIDESWWTIVNRLIAAGRRPYLVIQPSALRDCHLMLALHLVFLDYSTSAGDGGRWQALAAHYLTAYEQAWGQLRFTYDESDENRVDASKRKSARLTDLDEWPRALRGPVDALWRLRLYASSARMSPRAS